MWGRHRCTSGGCERAAHHQTTPRRRYVAPPRWALHPAHHELACGAVSRTLHTAWLLRPRWCLGMGRSHMRTPGCHTMPTCTDVCRGIICVVSCLGYIFAQVAVIEQPKCCLGVCSLFDLQHCLTRHQHSPQHWDAPQTEATHVNTPTTTAG